MEIVKQLHPEIKTVIADLLEPEGWKDAFNDVVIAFVLYVPFFWYYIMFVIKAIPEQIFKRLKL